MGIQKMDENTVTVSKETYFYLISEITFLDLLKTFGVEEWEGYKRAYEIHSEWLEKKNLEKKNGGIKL